MKQTPTGRDTKIKIGVLTFANLPDGGRVEVHRDLIGAKPFAVNYYNRGITSTTNFRTETQARTDFERRVIRHCRRCWGICDEQD
jgi:hypothetical protein